MLSAVGSCNYAKIISYVSYAGIIDLQNISVLSKTVWKFLILSEVSNNTYI